MKIVFVSSVLNHHQVEFCDEMYRYCKGEFYFVSTMDMEQQRLDLKYELFDRPYNIFMHQSKEQKRIAEQLFMNADVVMLGVEMRDCMRKRLEKGKITFLCKERLFKEKPSLYWRLRCWAYVVREYYPFRWKPFYMLAASAYSLKDYRSLGFFAGKTFSWGYFPPIKYLEVDQLIKERSTHQELHIMWAGRMIPWKNARYVVSVAEALKNQGIMFHVDMVGAGVQLEDLKQQVKMNNLEKYIAIHNPMPPDEIRKMMEQTDIYLFTSNREEGFGVVLVEAMNSACCVVASDTAGSTRMLVRDGYNGRIYRNDDVKQLCDIVIELARDYEQMTRLCEAGYQTVIGVHNAQIAAKRFYDVCQAMISNNKVPEYEYGPMSKCE